MRIVYCIGALISPGGTERVLANKANYFADMLGWDVHILIAEQQSKSLCYHFSDKVHIHDLAVNQYFYSIHIPAVSFFLNALRLEKVYKKKLESIKPDIIVVMERGYEDFVINKCLPLVPKVREAHASAEGMQIRNKFETSLKNKFLNSALALLYQSLLKKYDHVVLLTNGDKEYRKYLKYKTVIPNAVPKFGIHPSSLNNTKALSVGRLDKLKNFKDQILIWQKVVEKHPLWTLHIYGKGPEKEALNELIIELGLQHNVFLEGTITDIAWKYQECSLFLFTSLSEGFGMAIIEAMSMGLPVISYDCPSGPREIIENGVDGYLIPPGDLQTMTNCIDDLITDIELRSKLSKKALIKSEEYLSDNVMPQWVSLFKKLSNESGN